MMISVMTITGPRASEQIYRVTMNSLLKTSPYNSLLPSQLRTRFTNDLSVVDQDFARCLINLNYLFNLIGILTTMAIALPFLVLTLPLILIEGWLLEALYLVSSSFRYLAARYSMRRSQCLTSSCVLFFNSVRVVKSAAWSSKPSRVSSPSSLRSPLVCTSCSTSDSSPPASQDSSSSSIELKALRTP